MEEVKVLQTQEEEVVETVVEQPTEPAAKKEKKKRKISPLFIILGVVIGLYSISLLAPLFWGLFQSLKSSIDFDLNKVSLIGKRNGLQFKNYSIVLQYLKYPKPGGMNAGKIGLISMFINSILYALGGAIVQVTVQYIMAYVSARFRYKFGGFIVGLVIFCMALPIIGSQASSLTLAHHLNLLDSIPGMWLMKAYFLGMYFLVFHAQLRAFPMDFSEAASIDGAGNFTIMWRIIFPMVRNTYLTVILLLFVSYWNDYQTPLLYLPHKPTLALGLYYFTFQKHIVIGTLPYNKQNLLNGVPKNIAACYMVLLPILVLFIFLHKKLLGNLSMGGLKE